MNLAPTADVLVAFGVVGVAQPLAGGQQTVWRVGELVFKRLDSTPEMVAWQFDVLTHVRPDAGVRVAPPVPTISGAWVVNGWTAWQFVPGRPAAPNWTAVIAAGHRLHEALHGHHRPAFLDQRRDVWARADRLVWDFGEHAPHPALTNAFDARLPIDLPEQLLHGDLTGNVLIDDETTSAVIDFSPYWHPAAWADAVVVADAMLSGQADINLMEAIGTSEHTTPAQSAQLLLRAVLFRVVTGLLTGQDPADNPTRTKVVDVIVAASRGTDAGFSGSVRNRHHRRSNP